MFAIHGPQFKISRVKKFLSERHAEFRETKIKNYLFIRSNPKDILNKDLLQGITILEIEDVKEWIKFVKEYGLVYDDIFQKKIPKAGDKVLITSGEYKNLNLRGIVKSVGKRKCEIETTVFGSMVRISADIDGVEVLPEDT